MYNEIMANKDRRQQALAHDMKMIKESTSHLYQVWQHKEIKDNFTLDISDIEKDNMISAINAFFTSAVLPSSAKKLSIIFKPGISGTYETPPDNAIEALANNIERNTELKCDIHFYRSHTSMTDKATKYEVLIWGTIMLRRIQANWALEKPYSLSSGQMLNFFRFGFYDSLDKDELFDKLSKQIDAGSFIKDNDRLIGFYYNTEAQLNLMIMTPSKTNKSLHTIELILDYISDAKKNKKSLYVARPLPLESKPVLWTDAHTQLLEFATADLAQLKKPATPAKETPVSSSSLASSSVFSKEKKAGRASTDELIVSKEKAKEFSDMFSKLLKFTPTMTDVSKDQVKISINIPGLIESLLAQQTGIGMKGKS